MDFFISYRYSPVHKKAGVSLFIWLFTLTLYAQNTENPIANDNLAKLYLDSASIYYRAYDFERSAHFSEAAFILYGNQADINREEYFNSLQTLIKANSFLNRDSKTEILVSGLLISKFNNLPSEVDDKIKLYRIMADFKSSQIEYYSSKLFLDTAMQLATKFIPENIALIVTILLEKELRIQFLGNFQAGKMLLDQADKLLKEAVNKYPLEEIKLNRQYARFFTRLGNIENAIYHYNLALDQIQKKSPIDSIQLAKTLNEMGLCYRELKDYKQAMEYNLRALEIYKLKRTAKLQIAYLFASSEIGNNLLALNEYQAAYEIFQANYELCEKNYTKREELYWQILDLAKYNYAIGNYSESKKQFEEAASFIKNIGEFDVDYASIIHRIAENCIKLSQWEEAELLIEKELNILQKLPANEKIVSAYSQLSEIKYNQFKSDPQDSLLGDVLYYFQLYTENLQDQIRMENFPGALKLKLNESIKVREKFLKVCFELKDKIKINIEVDSLIWAIVESAHGQMLKKQISESNASRFGGIPEQLLQLDSSFSADITKLKLKKDKLLQNNKAINTDTLILSLDLGLQKNKDRQDSLRAEFAKLYPKYYNLKFDESTISVANVQEVLSPDQTLIEYFTGDSLLVVCIVKKNEKLFFKYPIDFPIVDWIYKLNNSLTEYFTSELKTPELYERTVKQYAEYAYKLSSKLILPFQSHLTPELIIIPDAKISSISFDALLLSYPVIIPNFKTYEFIANRYLTSYDYSASIFVEANKSSNRIEKNKLLAFAPFFNLKTEPGFYQKETALRYGLSVLPYSGEEVKQISEIVDVSVDRYTGKLATKERFVKECRKFSILHLATHGRANIKEGEFSYLAFYADSLENGLLTAAEVYDIKLDADLLCLSACESAAGYVQSGEGIVSIARAMNYAGARSIVATLWKVNDQATMQLMSDFYRGLGKGKPKNLALTEAKRNYLQSKPNANIHPFYWSGFILNGNLKAIKI